MKENSLLLTLTDKIHSSLNQIHKITLTKEHWIRKSFKSFDSLTYDDDDNEHNWQNASSILIVLPYEESRSIILKIRQLFIFFKCEDLQQRWSKVYSMLLWMQPSRSNCRSETWQEFTAQWVVQGCIHNHKIVPNFWPSLYIWL